MWVCACIVPHIVDGYVDLLICAFILAVLWFVVKALYDPLNWS